MYFRFVDDVTFSHNGANGPESKTMRVYMFRLVRQVAGDRTGGEVAVRDWSPLLLCTADSICEVHILMVGPMSGLCTGGV